MIADWRTYSAEDFIPFTDATYFRLLERHYEGMWPFMVLGILAGIATAAFAIRGYGKPAILLLVAAWAWAGLEFLMGPYAELIWAGQYFGWAFVAQAMLLLGLALTGSQNTTRHIISRSVGIIVLAVGVLVLPLIAPLTGRGWNGSEFFGAFPDPTVLATLGTVVILTRGWQCWILLVIPLLWCAITGITLAVLGAPHAWIFPSVAILTIASAIAKK